MLSAPYKTLSQKANSHAFFYAEQYCEENIWHLCQNERLGTATKKIVFISNAAKACPFLYQQANPDTAIFWDYHVVLLCAGTQWLIWDLDTTLSLPILAKTYLTRTFSPSGTYPAQYQPQFRIVHAREYIAHFYSDRAHMRDAAGHWLAPPPPWPVIANTTGATKTLSLHRLIDFSDPLGGQIMELDEMLSVYA